jgi:hypothetical protein
VVAAVVYALKNIMPHPIRVVVHNVKRGQQEVAPAVVACAEQGVLVQQKLELSSIMKTEELITNMRKGAEAVFVQRKV